MQAMRKQPYTTQSVAHAPGPRAGARRADVSPQQVREARALLGWSRERLGAMSEVSANFVAIYEKSGRAMASCPSALHPDQLAQLRVALEAAGIEFLGPNESGASVRLVARQRD